VAKIGLVQDERFQRHDTGPGHPERPQRLARIAEVLAERKLDHTCASFSFEPVDMKAVERLHERAYLDRLRAACDRGASYIDVPDSAICPESYEIARLATGAALSAADRVMDGELQSAFCAVRPPGHHAEKHMSMGFCLFNNIALAAQHLIDNHGLERVLILDWDVHHGNGTQHLFESDPRVYFISLHGHPRFVYPGTGYAHERGKGAGDGFTLNIPMMPGAGDDEYRRAFDESVLPAVEGFKPQFVLISAGFDAHKLDPLAPIELPTLSFEWMSDALIDMAKRHADGKIVSLLEGGYHLDALAECVALHIERLLAA